MSIQKMLNEKRVTLSLIAACSENNVIGKDNKLPWKQPTDLRMFRQKTQGSHLIVGRKTFESIGKALPGRTMIVLTRAGIDLPEGCKPARTLEEAIGLCPTNQEVFVIGGGEIYNSFLPFAKKIYVTKIKTRVEGDAYFPEIDTGVFVEAQRLRDTHNIDDDHPMDYITYTRLPTRNKREVK